MKLSRVPIILARKRREGGEERAEKQSFWRALTFSCGTETVKLTVSQMKKGLGRDKVTFRVIYDKTKELEGRPREGNVLGGHGRRG